jgi:hypothetical protein
MRRYEIIKVWTNLDDVVMDFCGMKGTAYQTSYDSDLGGWFCTFFPAIWADDHTLDVPEWALLPLPVKGVAVSD